MVEPATLFNTPRPRLQILNRTSLHRGR